MGTEPATPRVPAETGNVIMMPQRGAGLAAKAAGAASPRRVRRWSINGDFVTLNPNGVARYAREVTEALDGLMAQGHPLARDLELDIVVPRPVDLGLHVIGTRVVVEYDRPRLPQLWVQAQLPRHVPGGLLSFCNLAPVAVKRQIVCIHDLHTRLMPESYGFGFRLAHRLILPALGRRAAHITTVSQLSREHLAHFGIAPADKISVTYNGADHALRWEAARSTLQTTGRGYVLCLGREQKYKNLELMVRLAPVLDGMGLDLWIAGDAAEQAVGKIESPIAPNIKLLGRISDDDFKQALTGAVCFLFPSRIEGFGLPAVEAMASGCPVVASTSPCLPEVCGDAALYADPDDLDGWADAVRALLHEPQLRQELVAAGHIRAAKFSWRGIAEIYLELMANVDGAPA